MGLRIICSPLFLTSAAHPNLAAADVRVENNYLQFSHLEPNFNQGFGFFSYAPQNQPPAESLAAVAGVPQTFDATDGANTQYQWQVGVNEAWTDIPRSHQCYLHS